MGWQCCLWCTQSRIPHQPTGGRGNPSMVYTYTRENKKGSGLSYEGKTKKETKNKHARLLRAQMPSPKGPRLLLGGPIKARTIRCIAKMVGRGLAQLSWFETPGSTVQYLRRDDARKALHKTSGCTPRLGYEWTNGARDNNKLYPQVFVATP